MTPRAAAPNFVHYRGASENDLPFIYNSWLKSYMKSQYAREMEPSVYFEGHKALVVKLLRFSAVVVAYAPADHEQILGYVAFMPGHGVNVVHYMYVKSIYRKMGIGSALLRFIRERNVLSPTMPIISTHATPAFHALRAHWNLVYNPYVTERLPR